MSMYALSLWRPWPWMFHHAGKRVENRSWALPDFFVGKRIAMHATQKFDHKILVRMRAGEFGEAAKKVPVTGHPTGIVGVFTFGKSFEFDLNAQDMQLARSFSEFDAETARETIEEDPFMFGPHVWPTTEVCMLSVPSIPCKGHRRLWKLPSEIERAVGYHLRVPALQSGVDNVPV